jgi:hypothetical protein
MAVRFRRGWESGPSSNTLTDIHVSECYWVGSKTGCCDPKSILSTNPVNEKNAEESGRGERSPWGLADAHPGRSPQSRDREGAMGRVIRGLRHKSGLQTTVWAGLQKSPFRILTYDQGTL